MGDLSVGWRILGLYRRIELLFGGQWLMVIFWISDVFLFLFNEFRIEGVSPSIFAV